MIILVCNMEIVNLNFSMVCWDWPEWGSFVCAGSAEWEGGLDYTCPFLPTDCATLWHPGCSEAKLKQAIRARITSMECYHNGRSKRARVEIMGAARSPECLRPCADSSQSHPGLSFGPEVLHRWTLLPVWSDCTNDLWEMLLVGPYSFLKAYTNDILSFSLLMWEAISLACCFERFDDLSNSTTFIGFVMWTFCVSFALV